MLERVAAGKVEVVETGGAGDSFIASLLAAYLFANAPAQDALSAATRAAAETCSHEGGFPQPLNPVPAWLLGKYADVIASAET